MLFGHVIAASVCFRTGPLKELQALQWKGKCVYVVPSTVVVFKFPEALLYTTRGLSSINIRFKAKALEGIVYYDPVPEIQGSQAKQPNKRQEARTLRLDSGPCLRGFIGTHFLVIMYFMSSSWEVFQNQSELIAEQVIL